MVQADEKKQKNLEAVAKEIKAAVKAGKITEKEAKAKFAALKKQGHEKKEPGRAEWILMTLSCAPRSISTLAMPASENPLYSLYIVFLSRKSSVTSLL